MLSEKRAQQHNGAADDSEICFDDSKYSGKLGRPGKIRRMHEGADEIATHDGDDACSDTARKTSFVSAPRQRMSSVIEGLQ